MSKFTLDKQKCRVINVNPRKEASGDDKGATLATDIKLEIEDLPAEALKPLFPENQGGDSIVDSLFTDTGTPRFNGITVASAAEFENVDAHVYGQKLPGAKVKKFRVTKLSDGAKVNLRFTLQVHPTGAALGAISEKIKEEVKVTLEPQPELPLEHAA